jgi:hypothetical protein
VTAAGLCRAPAAAAQDTSDDELPEADSTTVIDEPPLLSTRAAGMGGALTTTADDLDAAMLNPAGIGGLGWGKRKVPTLRKLYFPRFAVAANGNTRDLNSDFSDQGGANDPAVGEAIVDAHAGERQYGRANALLGAVIGRTLIAPFSDLQLAAVSRGDSGMIDARYRTMTGIAYGISVADSQDRLSFGYSGYLASRNETTGTFDYLDIVDKDARAEALKDKTVKYSGLAHNVGFNWTMTKTARPTLGVAVKNAGDTVYAAQTGGAEDLTVAQDLTVAFSVAPQISKNLVWLFALEGQHLGDDDVTIAKKYRVGTELLYDGLGSYALFGLRGGYNDAGASCGLSLNLGLIALEAAQESVDVGIGNEKVIEKRVSGTLYVNVAEF